MQIGGSSLLQSGESDICTHIGVLLWQLSDFPAFTSCLSVEIPVTVDSEIRPSDALVAFDSNAYVGWLVVWQVD